MRLPSAGVPKWLGRGGGLEREGEPWDWIRTPLGQTVRLFLTEFRDKFWEGIGLLYSFMQHILTKTS